MRGEPRIVASVLGADYAHLGREVVELEQAGVHSIQWDIMDGHFVSDLTFGPGVLRACGQLVDLPFEAHLMVENPGHYVDRLIAAGCETIIIHAEAVQDIGSVIETIVNNGGRPGLALSPATPLAVATQYLERIGVLLVMSVQPGAAGQRYLPHVEPKISQARQLLDESGLKTLIEVDGGINPSTIGRAWTAGAEGFVAGSWILNHTAGKSAAVSELGESLSAIT